MVQRSTGALHQTANGQPGRRLARLGGRPLIDISRPAVLSSIEGMELSSIDVYRCLGRAKMSSTDAISTIEPAYITAT